jgi:hypothetical protein
MQVSDERLEVIALLLQAGADPTATSPSGLSVSDELDRVRGYLGKDEAEIRSIVNTAIIESRGGKGGEEKERGDKRGTF